MVSCLAVLSVVTWAAGVSALPGRELVRVTPTHSTKKKEKKRTDVQSVGDAPARIAPFRVCCGMSPGHTIWLTPEP